MKNTEGNAENDANVDDPEFLALLGAISDGEPIDWETEAASGSEDRRAAIRTLRLMACVADLHRQVQAEPLPLLFPLSLPSAHIAQGGVRTSVPLPGQIGRYRILRLIAEGGMGAVYEAEQDRPRRTVALKVIRPGYASASMLKRFERESQVLARLQHPGIAQIYDAGAADFGFGLQPFFAMEFIRGEPLLRHAEERGLGTRDRIDLLARVADAADHAHQKGVIHRDLKPGNILVDESGQPKVLDFGVARATDSDVQSTMGTDIGQLVGTLSYMSPEQVAGDPAQLDTRSDVYSLGVVLYELLARRLPYALSGKLIPEIAAIIREQEPMRLSSIDRTLRGDVETIVSKALEKEKRRRYESAADLALDLRRYLRGEPIAARPSTTLYQVRKFARRQPYFVGALIAAFLTLIAGIVGTGLGLVRATRQRNVAERETQKALYLNNFMQELLASARPGAMGTGRDIKVADILDRAAMDLPGRFKEAPELEMEARATLGQTYSSLGLYDEAVANLERAFEIAQVRLPEESEERLKIADRLAWALSTSKVAPHKGEELAKAALPVARRALGASHPCTLSLMNTLSMALVLQKGSEAEPILNELLALLRAAPPVRRGIPTSAVMIRLARIRYYAENGWEIGEALARESLETAATEKVSVWEDVAQNITVMAAEILQGRYPDEGERLYRRALDDARRTLGRSHAESLHIGVCLAELLSWRDRPAEALDLWREMLEYSRSHSWKPAPWKEYNAWDKAWLLAAVAKMAARSHRPEEAAGAWREAISLIRGSYGDADRRGQELWREWTMRFGLGIQERWPSEAIRTQVRRLMADGLDSHPTKTFAPGEIQWNRLRFRLSRWSGKTNRGLAARGGTDTPKPPSAEMAGGDSIGGDIDLLKSLREPAPGLYRLSIEVPRSGGEALREAAWMLVSPWSLELSLARFAPTPEPGRGGGIEGERGREDEAWRERLRSAPDERRSEPALSLQGWWDTGFGPMGHEYNFGIRATTTLALPPGAYRFLVTANDGARLWIDDHLEIDAWRIRKTAATDSAVVNLSAAPHELRLDYFQSHAESILWVRAEPLDDREP